MTHSIPLDTVHISGLSSGMQMFGEHSHWDDPETEKAVRAILSLPGIWGCNALYIWEEEQISSEFN